MICDGNDDDGYGYGMKYDDEDDDLYIIGAVCMSVCHVFAYFIFSLFQTLLGLKI